MKKEDKTPSGSHFHPNTLGKGSFAVSQCKDGTSPCSPISQDLLCGTNPHGGTTLNAPMLAEPLPGDTKLLLRHLALLKSESQNSLG